MAGFWLGSVFGQTMRAIWGPAVSAASDDAAETVRQSGLQSTIYEDAVAIQTIAEELALWDSESAGRRLSVHFPEHLARMHTLRQLAEATGTNIGESALLEEMLVRHVWDFSSALDEFVGEAEAGVSEREQDGDDEMPEAAGLESEEADDLKKAIEASMSDVTGGIGTTGAAGGGAPGKLLDTLGVCISRANTRAYTHTHTHCVQIL
jgi:hypothetical protein